MVFDRYLEPDDRERIEGYLAHKWGITEDLAGTTFKTGKAYPCISHSRKPMEVPFTIIQGRRNATLQDIPVTDLSAARKFGSGLKLGNMPASRIEMGMNAVDLPNNWTISVWLETPLVENGLVDYWHTLPPAQAAIKGVVLDQAGNKELGIVGIVDFRGSGYGEIRYCRLASSSAVGLGSNTKFYVDGTEVGSPITKSMQASTPSETFPLVSRD